MKALFGLAASGVLFGLPISAHAVEASQETTEALAAAQAEYEAVQAQMDELAAEYQELSIEQDQTISQIEALTIQIDDLQEQIDDQQEELEKKQEQLSQRISGSYKSGDRDILALLLSSASFDELINNVYYINKVNESDQQAIQEVHDIQEELKVNKADLETQKAELEQLKETQAAQLKQMKAKKDEVQELLDGLSEEVLALIAQRDAELLAAAQAEEEARKAAEAAAAAAAASGSSSSSGGAAYVTQGTSQAVSGSSLQELVVSSCNVTPSPGYGLCAAWVTYVFLNAGLSAPYGNADDMYNSYCVSSDKSQLKVGMIIAVSTHSKTYAGSIYGHVGIYVGNNTVMDNVGYIRSINVDSWINYFGDTVTPRWGWACGVNLEG